MLREAERLQIEKKVKLALCIPRYMGEMKVYFHAFLTSKLEGSGWSTTRAAIFLEKYHFVPTK